MPFGSIFRQTSVSAQTRPKRRSVWKKVFCTFPCCGRRTYGEDDGLVGAAYILTDIRPIQRRLPYLGPIQDASHMTASREMKKPASPVSSLLGEDESTRAQPSVKSSSIIDENQATDIAFPGEQSSLITTTRVEPKRHHIQTTICLDVHHHTPSQAVTSHTICEQKLSIGRHIECGISLPASTSFIQTGCLSLSCERDDVTPNVKAISFNETTIPSLTNQHRHFSDVTNLRHTSQPVPHQGMIPALESLTISRHLSRDMRVIQSAPTYQHRTVGDTLDVRYILTPSQNQDIASSFTSLTLSRHQSRVMPPTYHRCRGASIADFGGFDLSSILKTIRRGDLIFPRDILWNEASSTALTVLDNDECVPTSPAHIKATVSCQIMSFTIPPTRASATRCHSAPTTVYFAKLSITTCRRNCVSLIVGGVTRTGSNRWTQSAPDRLSYCHPLPSAFSKALSVPMVSRSMETPEDLPSLNVTSINCDTKQIVFDHTPACISPTRDDRPTSSCDKIQAHSLIRSPVCDVAAVQSNVSQQAYSGTEQVSALSSCNADNLNNGGQPSCLHPVSKEVQHSSENHMKLMTSVATNHPVDTTFHVNGCKLTRSRTPDGHTPVDVTTLGKNAIKIHATPSVQRCRPKGPLVPTPAVALTTNISTGKNITTTRPAAIDNNNVQQLPLLGQSDMPAWNRTTNWWDSNLFYQGATNVATGGQPFGLPSQLPWQPTAAPGANPIGGCPFKTPNFNSPTIGPRFGGSPRTSTQNHAPTHSSKVFNNVPRGLWNDPLNQNGQTTTKASSPGHAQNTNAVLQPQPQYNPFQNYTADLWNIPQYAMQSPPPKPLKPSDYNLPSSCDVIPKKDLEGICNWMNMPTILGRGNFGEVRLMKQLSSGRLCAVKVHHKNRDDKTIIKDLQREVSTLTLLNKLDCIPKLFGISRIGKDTDVPVIVQEFVGDPTTFKSTTVDDVILAKGLNGPKSFSVAIQLCRAMKDIHFAGTLHCDLKTDNILYMKGSSGEDGDVRIKIIDFGKAVSRNDKPIYEHFPRNEHADILKRCVQLAPEVVRGLRPYSLYSDVYSVGLVLVSVDVSPGKFLTKLGMKCLSEDWNQRPNIHELINEIDSYIKDRQASYSRWAKVG